ncbi:MAG: hypothetical protein ABI743_05255 [bacterium]
MSAQRKLIAESAPKRSRRVPVTFRLDIPTLAALKHLAWVRRDTVTSLVEAAIVDLLRDPSVLPQPGEPDFLAELEAAEDELEAAEAVLDEVAEKVAQQMIANHKARGGDGGVISSMLPKKG